MSLELAKKMYFEEITENTKNGAIISKIAIENSKVLEMINLASKPDWKYPEKGELPKEDLQVIFITQKNSYFLGYFFTIINSFSADEYDFTPDKIAAWCELPVFNKA